MGDFVRPEIVRLPLSEGRWIDVKKRLTAGETRKMLTRLIKGWNDDGVRQIDPEFVGLTKLLAYVLGWSFTDDAGKPVAFNAKAIDDVDPDLYGEMIAAVDTHIQAQEQERAAEKNGQSGAVAPSAISSSAA